MNTVQVQVGQEVAVRSAYGHGDYSFGWVVTRVTAKTGQIVVRKGEIELRFDANGREFGRPPIRRSDLEVDVAMARGYVARRERSIKAANALVEIQAVPQVRWTWSKESMLEEVARLEAQIAAARAAVEAV